MEIEGPALDNSIRFLFCLPIPAVVCVLMLAALVFEPDPELYEVLEEIDERLGH